MTPPYQPAHARERADRIPLPVLLRRLCTAWLLLGHGTRALAGIRHEPFPDLQLPGACGACLLDADAPVHRRPKRTPPRHGDPAQAGGWR